MWGLFDADRSGGLDRGELTRLCRLVFAEQQQLLKARLRRAGGLPDGVDVDAAVDAAVTEFSEGGALEALVDDVMTRADADGNGTIDPKELKHYFFLQRRPRKAGGKTVAGELPAPGPPAAAADG